MRSNWIALSALAAAVAVAASHWFIWSYAPVEATMGPVQKIFYLHLPLAWWSMFSFFVVFCAGVAFLLRRDMAWDHLAAAAAEVGVLFSGLMLVTGMLWARKSWNVWWTWDPRLTTALIMWFVYAAYLIVRASGLPRERRATICAVLGVVAFLDVPLVFYSARLWRSIHPAVLASKGGGLEPEMKTTLFVCLGAWTFLWLALVALRARQKAMEARLDSLAANERYGDEQ
ncbi:MAG: cytochrome c biogenesis protein CcsA [Desulfovibrionaceae bacterium]|jgi:heme exporter protein C|nr:cytochrome c biogenesis protein CcsA [Desulfovibrionaceae bacterium]